MEQYGNEIFSGLAYLRADVSRSLGLGHISRSIAMAKTLERRGIQSVVFCRELDHNWSRPIAKLDQYGSLIRKIVNEDEFISCVERKDAKYLFFDLIAAPCYATLIPRLITLFPAFRTVCFDSFYDDDLKYDLHVGPSFDGTTIHKNGISGLKYFVFPDELRQLAPTKGILADVGRVLITMGGSDTFQATPVIVRALCGFFPSFQFTVVIGPGFAATVRKELLELAQQYSNLVCELEPEHLGNIYVASDFAIISGGQTKFEAALFGIPSIILSNSPQEEELSNKFAILGASIFHGRADQLVPSDLREQFVCLIGNGEKLREMSRRGKQILDIYGGERILDYIHQTLP